MIHWITEESPIKLGINFHINTTAVLFLLAWKYGGVSFYKRLRIRFKIKPHWNYSGGKY